MVAINAMRRRTMPPFYEATGREASGAGTEYYVSREESHRSGRWVGESGRVHRLLAELMISIHSVTMACE